MVRLVRECLSRRGFVKDDNGSIIVFVLVVFSAMFLVGGTAVDLARHENLRSTLQYNLDRAVLAAASLKQTQDPKVVVNDYMSKVITNQEFTVTVTSTVNVNSRAVSATADATLDTWFLSMAGINDMPIRAASAAEERIPNLEISLVLDVSGSMKGSKLSNLKVAAKEFVTTMLKNTDPDSVSISVVPFNHNVAPGRSIFDNLTIDETHNLSTCLDFADADFASTGIDPTVSQTQAVFTALYGDSFQEFDEGDETCYAEEWFEIMPHSDSETALHAKIQGLDAQNGWTAAHLGMKWGLALLDPSFRPVVTSLIDEDVIEEGFAGAPVDWSDPDTMKVVVLMGDGANTYEFRLGSQFRGPQSGLWEIISEEPGQFTHLTYYGRTYRGSSYERYCGQYGITCYYGEPEEVTSYFLKKPSNGRYYSITGREWVYGSEFQTLLDAAEATISGDDPNGILAGLQGRVIGGVTLTNITAVDNMSWEKAWGHMSAEYYDDITGGGAFNDLVYGTARGTSEADVVMTSACDAARLAGVVVYTIGYETNASTSAKLKSCATTGAHNHDASQANISEVFSAIAASIQKLKLTQ